MRLKHFCGYGFVEAVKKYGKVFKSSYGDYSITLHILVSGKHEQGLVTLDKYTIYHWFVKRFSRHCKSHFEINNVKVYDKFKGDIEECLYEIDIHVKSKMFGKC